MTTADRDLRLAEYRTTSRDDMPDGRVYAMTWDLDGNVTYHVYPLGFGA